jgi:hypothetical protein
MQRHKFFVPIGPGAEIGIEGNGREFALEVQRIFFAIDRIVQVAIDVVKNVTLGVLSSVFRKENAGSYTVTY